MASSPDAPLITIWRIVKKRLADHAFDGEGARLYGGRWSSPGRRVVYAAESLSLALLEVLVHAGNRSLLDSYVWLRAELPSKLVDTLDETTLPDGWSSSPVPPQVQAVGDRWLRGATGLALRLPSAIVPGEFNFLVAPSHPDFHRVRVSPPVRFPLDPRFRPGQE